MIEHRFTNQVALILGGTSGIGRAAALRFAAEGAAVVIGGRNVGNGEDISEEICGAGGDALFARTDVGSLEQVQAIVADPTSVAMAGSSELDSSSSMARAAR